MFMHKGVLALSTKELATFAANIKYENLAPETIRKTKQCLLEWLGVCIRGSKEQSSKLIREVLLTEDSCSGQAHVFAEKNVQTSALNAAFCNGSASHSLDFDDLHNSSIIHLACVVIPPVLALGEAEHKNGKNMLVATVAGYEVGARVGEAVIPESYFFWHTTGTAGTFGAGAAAASILGLDGPTFVQAMGSAGTQAAGLWEFLKEGAMSKTLHAGKSAYAGVLSAYLAQKGFTGATQIMEGDKGFCKAMVKKPHLEKLTEKLGQGYKIDENSFKPYACCKHSHACLYAVQVLRKNKKLLPADIAGIELHINKITNFLINNPEPQNSYGCKFSIQYCVAGMLKYGEMGIDKFAPDVINDREVRAIMKNIVIVNDSEIEAVHAANSAKLASKVVLHCKDGRILEMQVDYPKGDPPNPMTWEESVEKFMNLVVPVYGEIKADKFCQLFNNLEQVDDFSKAIESILK